MAHKAIKSKEANFKVAPNFSVETTQHLQGTNTHLCEMKGFDTKFVLIYSFIFLNFNL